MDIVQYTADRFPKAFGVFLNEQFPTRSILRGDLYVHNQTVEDAYEFHRRAGYGTFYFLQTRRGQLHRNIYLAVKTKPHDYRVVFTNLRGLDQEADVYCQISHSDTFSSMHSVHSSRELPLFVFNPSGISLKLNDKDWLLFGFKGKWEKVLLEQNWQRTSAGAEKDWILICLPIRHQAKARDCAQCLWRRCQYHHGYFLQKRRPPGGIFGNGRGDCGLSSRRCGDSQRVHR